MAVAFLTPVASAQLSSLGATRRSVGLRSTPRASTGGGVSSADRNPERGSTVTDETIPNADVRLQPGTEGGQGSAESARRVGDDYVLPTGQDDESRLNLIHAVYGQGYVLRAPDSEEDRPTG